MIPPCDPAILDSNPQFKKLYQDLTTSLLNPDGSTRANDTHPARKAVVEDLKKCRIRHAKKQIKKRTLRALAFNSESGLPDEHRDVVGVISLYLDSSSSQEESERDDILTLLAPDIEKFYTSVPAIIPPFSTLLSSTVGSLRTIANAGTAPTPPAQAEPPRSRFRTRQAVPKASAPPLLSAQLGDRIRRHREIQLVELPAGQGQMAVTAAAVLAARAQVLERTVVLLERAKHGALARATKAKAEHLASVAQAVEGKLNVTKLDILNEIYTPETISALGRYRQHLRDVRGRLEERHAGATEELKAYETVGPGISDSTRPMSEIARRYGALAQEVEGVKMEIRRLEE